MAKSEHSQTHSGNRRFGRRSFAKLTIMAGVAMIVGSTLSVAGEIMPSFASSSVGIGEPTESAITVKWSDQHTQASDLADPNYNNFKNLVFTVNQTQNLSHQGITVSWSGGTPTSATKFATNFMQAMQCWGDMPQPTQCQFGAPTGNASNLTGYDTQTRVIDTTLDPAMVPRLSSDYAIPPENEYYAFPYVKPDGSSTFNTQELFSSATTNEISAVATAADGTGMFNFEVQTGLDAPHLACGQYDSNMDGPRACSLVIVPRGALDPTGLAPAFDDQDRVSGSPLTYSAWKNRIVIPLSFAPIGQSCAMNQKETRIVGSDIVSKAVNSWQAGLCGNGKVFGFSRISDDEARTQITKATFGASHMAIVSGAIAADDVDALKLDYAPVAQSAIVIAYNIDYALYRDSANYALKDGTKVHTLKLTQRLVAKLLTQSYASDTPGLGEGNPTVKANPRSLLVDPEFLALNPDFRDFVAIEPQGLMVAFGNADAYAHVWEWVRSNADAKSFLEGKPDRWGMKVNPSYQSLGLTEGDASVSFPKADLHTYTADPSFPTYGTLDMRPYFNSLDETGLRTLRADGNVKSSWDPFKLPPAYVSLGPQPAGQRVSLAITDLSTAFRYGLDVAELQGSVDGDFVLPTVSAVEKQVDHRVLDEKTGVAATDWTAAVEGAYPLSEVVYGAVNICTATDDERKAYADFLTYVTGNKGQSLGFDSGALPFGYVPLSSAQRSLSTKTISDIKLPANTATRCADPVKTTTTQSIPQAPAAVPVASTVSTGATVTKKKMFIAKPMYGDGTTVDALPIVSRILTAGGYVLGIPFVIVGYLLLRRSRRLS